MDERREDGLPDAPWAMDADEVVSVLDTSRDGLSEDEVESRRERFGPNRLREIERRGVWQILWEQLRSLIMLLLVAAMVVSFLTGDTVEGLAILAVIALNTAIGFVTEWRAVRSMEALQKLGEVTARVRRGGDAREVPAHEIVPGDRVLLEGGSVVPADVRLVETDGVTVDESALTGESVPVEKGVEPVDENAELAERTSMVFRGTAVARGCAEGVVVATGMTTELGEISAMVEEADAGQAPLEERLEKLGRSLVWLTLAVAAAVAVSGIVVGREIKLMVQTAIALAVAAIPEGLPIVATVALAHGMWRMVQRNALIRRLSSVETLGATTLICTDKTGTLTENQMTVRELRLAGGARVEIDDGEEERPGGFSEAVRAAVMCTHVDDGDRVGDPMEAALIDLGERTGRPRSDLVEKTPELRQVPFDRDSKMMASYHRADDGVLVVVKGAPEAVLQASDRRLEDTEERPLGDEERRHWTGVNEEMAANGLRVLGLAQKRTDDEEAEPYRDLVFLGLLGLHDPPREEVPGAVERCRSAGIRVVMVTGDHPATAAAIARAVRLSDDDEIEVIAGADLDEAKADGDRVRRASVFARVSPRQKLDLIDLHQEAGEVVAMTGDGVNDAPALRSADIGIAMGRRGTEVARQASDMILQDDRFPTIVAAVERGRVIFDNIRKFVVYLLSGNVGEILAVGVAATAGLALPLKPLQILYLNMLNDVFPALALGLGGAAGAVMERPPRDPEEPVICRRHWAMIGGYGAVIAAAVLGAFVLCLGPLGFSEQRAVAVAFLSLSIGRLLHALNMRTAGSGPIRNEITRNPFMWGAWAICLGLLLLAIYLKPLAEILALEPPGTTGWLVVVGASFVPLIVGQVALWILHLRSDGE